MILALMLAGPGILGVPITSKPDGALSAPMQVVVLMTLMSLLPAIVMSLTPFLRITVVLHCARLYGPYGVSRGVVAYDAPVVQKLGA